MLVKNTYLNWILRIAAGLVFVLSAVLKYLSIDSFDMYVYEHGRFGYEVTESLTRCLVAAELCLGTFLIIGVFPRFTKYTMLLFLTAFTVYLLLLPAVFGIESENCHCFGEVISFNRWQSIVKNLILIALLLPYNPTLGWRFRWPKIAFATAAVASLVAVFALITPSYIDTALYGKTITIDDELFRTTVGETDGGETFLHGRQIVCFYSTACGYCRKSAKKVHLAMRQADIPSDKVRIVFWHTDKSKPISLFFEKAEVPELEHITLDAETFLNITNGVMPLIAFVNDGTVAECHKYIELNERQMKDFLTEK
jgi:uncharacterized membrane protein YphA (DoxX/SURF4 family)